eukprot:GEMP01034519.1.p1 GENE.GEMP01034519.1~~GEMP01034519.1.p1  ORF type:complete len:228 (+),score=41.27 GEMP01034519.1:245-928(+)
MDNLTYDWMSANTLSGHARRPRLQSAPGGSKADPSAAAHAHKLRMNSYPLKLKSGGVRALTEDFACAPKSIAYEAANGCLSASSGKRLPDGDDSLAGHSDLWTVDSEHGENVVLESIHGSDDTHSTVSVLTIGRRKQKMADDAKLKDFLASIKCKSVNSKRILFLGKFEYPLHKAVKMNDSDLVRILLENGADRDLRASSSKTPLQKALQLNQDDSYAQTARLLQCW